MSRLHHHSYRPSDEATAPLQGPASGLETYPFTIFERANHVT
jgi:hypothetical protein